MNLELEYPKSNNPEGPIEISVNLLLYMINTQYQTVEGQQRRVVGRLQTKLEDAKENKTAEIKLEQAETDIVKDVIKVATPSQWSRMVMVLEDEINSL